MEKEIKAFQIDLGDNVATALAGIKAGQEAGLTGDCGEESIKAAADIPAGHKIAGHLYGQMLGVRGQEDCGGVRASGCGTGGL